ncbi:peptidase S8/S53 subtilisin kexin sedolisin [Kribbella sindirgiensis]|uniref:Peptidase S8/S53 subtilisin kexin sedolisin n=1 Tax=Kribbella sindirgiensis TaxID=1124744 RepID=A0A4R0I260_9ACTN|nr:peptidase S8/S53 subtilisin kexin sedolisin [Kribbella sindirgiensis]
MTKERHVRKRRLAAAALLLALIPMQQQADAAPKARTVTLITGDKVVVKGDAVTVDRPAGREKIGFEVRRTPDEWTVIPVDVRGDVATGKLDRRLFDLDVLLRDGYDDSARGDIPLIVTGAPTRKPAELKLPKTTAPGFLRARTAGTKVWLDAKLHTSLDKSVPQIGAPTAWKAGYAGKGVTVAVLDSGIDANHPDLTGKVVAAKNFTTAPAADVFGHGTHVAATVAGRGADGYKGVAPDATLLDGKVCDDTGGCAESDVLEGIEWAVAQKAKVVNLSLGGSQEGGPLDQAIDRITQQTGTLFVIAAGNFGVVESPGTAASGLTVGAVDRDEKLAGFSGRGPTDQGAIKPDVTAPGVGIVAARSAASHPQDPVGDKYTRMTGTSMATPHVAGTAALLAQQHPSWKATELKAAITSSAKANPALKPYEQGSGRVDAARAVQRTVIATTTNVSFGRALWPHADDKPVTKDVTFENTASTPVTLSLQAELKNGATAGVLQLSTNQLTVPAKGSASVKVTSETAHDGPDGLYTGRLTATAGSQQIGVPLVVDKEVESYNVALTALGPDGKPLPADRAMPSLQNLDTFASEEPGRVPKGRYALDVTLFGPAGEHYRIVQPEVDVRRDLKLVVDARKAKPVTVTVPRKDAQTFVVFFGYQLKNKAGDSVLTFNLKPRGEKLYLGRMGPAVPAEQFQGFVASYVGRLAADGTLTGTPYLYGLIDTQRGHFLNGLQRRVYSDRQLAHVVVKYNGPAGAQEDWQLVGRQPGVNTLPIGAPSKLPQAVHQYLQPETDWQQALGEVRPEPRQYEAGTTTYETLTLR